MADAVPGIGIVEIGAVLPVGEGVIAEIVLDLPPGGGEQGADQIVPAGGDARQPSQPGTPGEVKEDGLGVVVGGAFTAIVNSLVNDIINPAIGLFFNADFSDVGIHVGDVMIGIGSFINAVINFLIVAFVLFVVIKFVNSLHKKPAEPEAPAEPTTKVCPYCQSEISIKAVRCPHCTSKLEGFPEINN